MQNINTLLDERSMRLSDPLRQLITIPNFYPAFFGSNNREVFSKLAQTLINAAPRYSSRLLCVLVTVWQLGSCVATHQAIHTKGSRYDQVMHGGGVKE